MRNLAALAIVALLPAACGPGFGEPRVSSTPTVATRCEAAPVAVVTAISTGLGSGLTLRNAQMVRSDDFEEAYFVSADLQGPGLEGDDDVATWVTNNRSGGGLIFAVSAVAREFSDWGDGGQTDAGFSMSDDGADESAACVTR